MIQMQLIHVNQFYVSIYSFKCILGQISDLNLQTTNQTNSVMLFEAVFCGFLAIMLVFTACELGQRISDAFSSINDALDQFHWYLLPIDVQRILPTIIINAQQPLVVRCFGNVPCERETFKKVIKADELFSSIRP